MAEGLFFTVVSISYNSHLSAESWDVATKQNSKYQMGQETQAER